MRKEVGNMRKKWTDRALTFVLAVMIGVFSVLPIPNHRVYATEVGEEPEYLYTDADLTGFVRINNVSESMLSSEWYSFSDPSRIWVIEEYSHELMRIDDVVWDTDGGPIARTSETYTDPDGNEKQLYHLAGSLIFVREADADKTSFFRWEENKEGGYTCTSTPAQTGSIRGTKTGTTGEAASVVSVVTNADYEEEEKASLFEKIGAGFIALCGYGVYYLVGLAAGQNNMSIDTLIFNRYENTALTFFQNENDPTEVQNKYIQGYIQSTINNFFRFFSKLAIIAYMIILVYMGIRILLNAGADGRSKYSELFMYWVQGIAILFLFPYVIKYTIFINNAFVKFIDQNKERLLGVHSMVEHPSVPENSGGIEEIGANLSNAATALDAAGAEPGTSNYMAAMYHKAISTGWLVYAIAWCVMVIQLIGLLIVYFKRLLTVMFLIAIFPLVTISYAIDKIGDGKSQAFNNWYKEFAMNVFLQSFHAIVYVIGMALILNLGGESKPPSQSWLFIIIILTFISKGDDILRDIFHMNGGGGKTVQNMGQTVLATKGALDLAKDARNFVSSATGQDSRLGQMRQRMDIMGTRTVSSLQSAVNIATAEMASAQDSPEPLPPLAPMGGMGETAPEPEAAPAPELTELQQAAEIALDSNASEDEKSEALLKIANALNSEDEAEREQAMKELSEYLAEEDKEALIAAAHAIIASGTVPVDLEENIQVLLKLLQDNKKFSGRRVPLTEEEHERLKKANQKVKVRRPVAGAQKEEKTKKTSKKAARERYEKRNGPKTDKEKYTGVFTAAPSTARMQKARAAVADKQARAKAPRTFRQHVVNGGASVVNGAKAVVNKGKYQWKKAGARKDIMKYERGAFADVRKLNKLQKKAELLVKAGRTDSSEYQQLMNQMSALQGPNTNIGRLRARRASYAEKGIYFNTRGASQRYLNANAKLRQGKEYVKTSAATSGKNLGEAVNIPKKFHEAKVNRQNNKSANEKVQRAKVLLQKDPSQLSQAERKELEQIQAFVSERKPTRAVVFGRATSSNTRRRTHAQRKLENAQLMQSIRGAKAVHQSNRAILRNARVEERRALTGMMKMEVKTSVRMMSDRISGRAGDYAAARAEIEKTAASLRGRGIIFRPPRLSNTVENAINRLDDIRDRSGDKAKAKEGYATTRLDAYNKYQDVRKARNSAEEELAQARADIKNASSAAELDLAQK